MEMLTEEFFWQLGDTFTGHNSRLSRATGLRRFKNLFGASPNICNVIWAKIGKNVYEACEPKHLLWALCFLKQYHTDSTNKAPFRVDEKTFRKHVWLVIDLIGDLDTFKFEDRLTNSQPGQLCYVSIDGVDFRIQEPTPFDPKYYCHKFRASALRYEIGLGITTGDIVWAFGGYPAGDFPDLKLARELYIHQVMPGELTLADKGYQDINYFVTPNRTNPAGHKYIMSRHETVNKRLRQFRIMFHTFRHDIEKHKKCFDAVVNITALIIKLEDPLFPVMK